MNLLIYLLYLDEYIKKNIDVFIVFDDKPWNYLLQYYLYSIGVFNIEFIFCVGGTVKKVKETIKR